MARPKYRVLAVAMMVALAIITLQPNVAGAQTPPPDAYTLAKSFSGPFTCSTASNATIPTGLTTASSAQPGQCVAITIALTNDNVSGGLPITNIQLSDNFNGLIGMPNYGCFKANVNYTCTLTSSGFAFNTNGQANLAAGQTGQETFVAEVSPNASCGSSIANTATAPVVQNVNGNVTTTFTQFDNKEATAFLTVSCPAAVTVSKTVAVTPPGGSMGAAATTVSAVPGSTLTYTITVANNSGSTLSGISVSDTLQNGQIAGSSGSCLYSNSTYTCSIASIANGTSATVSFNTTVPTNFTGTIHNTATASYNNTTASSNQTTVNVSTTTGSITVTKSVLVNGTPVTATQTQPATAHPGDTLTYVIQISNGTNGAISNAVLTDVLQNGQNLGVPTTGYPTSCTYVQSTSTFSCAVGTLSSGSTVTYDIYTIVQQSFAGTIQNTANVGYTGGPTNGVNSNTTYVSVPSTIPTTSSTITLCGPVTAYSAPTAVNGYVVIGAVRVNIAPGAATTTTFAVTNPLTSLCAQFGLTNGIATSVIIGQNLSGQSVLCGTFQPSSVSGQLYLGTFPLTYVGTTIVSLIPGNYYCALLNASGQAYAFLSSIPTAITAPPHGSYSRRLGHSLIEF